MSFPSVPSTPSVPSETVTFRVTSSEFALLASFMAPLGIDESTGESVWVTGSADGTRQWIASGGEVTAVIAESGLRGPGTCEPRPTFEWAYPVPEHVLILLGKLFTSTDDISLTVSDESVCVSTAHHEVTLTQVTRHRVPPSPPSRCPTPSVTVSATDLWVMLVSASAWPGGGPTPDHEPVVSCAFDPERRQLVLSPRWSGKDIGPSDYRFTATPLANSGDLSPAFTTFNLSHSPLVQTLRDFTNAARIGDVTIHSPTPGSKHYVVTGEHWMLQLPTLDAIQPWGHDLDEVLSNIPFVWIDPQCVRLITAAVSPGHIDLEAVTTKSPRHGNAYRLTYVILPSVAPTLELYDEINAFNSTATQGHLVIENSRLLARRHVPAEEYLDLEEHIDAFIAEIDGLATLYSAMAF